MGNRNGSSRRKQRDHAYVYSDNRRNEYTPEKNGGSISRRTNQSQLPGYHQYPNGYGANPVVQPINNYPKANSSKTLFFRFIGNHFFLCVNFSLATNHCT